MATETRPHMMPNGLSSSNRPPPSYSTRMSLSMRHALQQVSERDAEHQRRHETAGKQRVVPESSPARIHDLVAELETDRPQDQRRKHQEHRDVEARKGRRIDRRESGEYRPAAGD